MTELVRLAISTALATPTDRPRSQTPGFVYLARIRPASRRVVELRLRQCVRLITADEIPPESFPWELLDVGHVGALTSAVRERFAPSTGRAILVALRGVLRACWQCGCYAWEDYEKRADAFARIEGVRLRRGRALAPREVSALHRGASARDRAMIALLFGAGLRRSEAVSVTWERFDGEALRVIGKGDRERRVPLPAWAVRSLVAVRPANATGPVLRLGVEGLRSALRTLADRLGLAKLTPHDARRTFISELLDVTDAATVAELSGHASLEQLRHYDRRGERAASDAVARLRPMVTDTRDE